MKFRFKIQDYQTRAVDAVCNVFDGQPYNSGLTYIMDKGKDYTLLDEESTGYANSRIALSEDQILENIKEIQKNANIPLSDKLSTEMGACSLDVEMETGTGKTYVYIKTMFELNKRYGWSKFIVVVPSVAIREGVKKSFDMTIDHFMEHYKKKARYFIYDSSNLSRIDSFSNSADINVMIINMQAFNTSLKEGARNNAARIIYSPRDDFGSRRPIDVIKANRPIIILDEPQKMGGDKTQKALKGFNPLFSLNYSATHRQKHNTVYVLDALDAYNEKLVKKIEVKGIEMKNITGTDGYLFLHQIVLSPDKPPMARLDFEMRLKSGTVKRTMKNFAQGDSIYAESGNMPQYADGYFITSIDPLADTVTLANGITLTPGEANGDLSEGDVRKIQIRETIISHFDKEEKLFKRGVKTLSLIFIDEVAKYRQYDEDGNPVLGDYGKVFEEEYLNELDNRLTLNENDPYQQYLRKRCSVVSKVHNGYFSVDTKGRYVDSVGAKASAEGKTSDDISAYDLILKDKERLLSFDEPTRFIFSHSALREGWDNPNIFQICTLKRSNNDIAQRQEVGRGLRICVDNEGNRMDKELLGPSVFDVNKLTVIASGSYASYINSLQTEMRENLTERPSKATLDYYLGKVVTASDGTKRAISKDDANAIQFYLISNGYVTMNGDITDKYKSEEASGSLAPLPDNLLPIKDGVIALTNAVFNPKALKDIFENARKTKLVENPLTPNFDKEEFQKLWKAITPRYAYKVNFDSQELIGKAIADLDKNLKVKRLQYVVRTGEQRDSLSYQAMYNAEAFTEKNTKHKAVYRTGITTKYDLVGAIAAKTDLTRKTVVAILKGIRGDVFDQFRVNPEDFISQVSKHINYQKATMVVQHITYVPAGGLPPYDASIFTADKTSRDIIKAHKSPKSVQEYIFPDGTSDESVERKFARELDSADEVLVYAKLPRGFQIPTPMGGYAPDWAIVFRRGTVKHMFFVAETKGSLDSAELRGIEDSKIECAKHLFNDVLQKEGIYYDKVVSYQDLMDQFRL